MIKLKVNYMHPEEGVIMSDTYPGSAWRIEKGGVLIILDQKGRTACIFKNWEKMEVTYDDTFD